MSLFGNLFGTSNQTPPTQTTTTVLSPEQRRILDLAMPGIQDFASHTPKRLEGSSVVGFDPSQVTGQNMALDAAGRQNQLAQGGTNTSNFWLSPDALDLSKNPAIKSAIEASVNPITDQLLRKTMPSLRSGSIASGGYGGSRQGISEGLATGEAARAAGDTASKVALDAQQNAIRAQLSALGLLPQTQQAELAGATTTSGVGDVRQGQAQAERTAAENAFNFDQYAPFLQSKELMALLQGLPGGSTVATGSVAPGPSTLSQVLGGAATGASLGSIFGPAGTTIGGLGGAALPFLFG